MAISKAQQQQLRRKILKESQEKNTMGLLILICFTNCVMAAASYSYISQLRGCRQCDCASDTSEDVRKIVKEMMKLAQTQVAMSLILFTLVLAGTYLGSLAAIKYLTALAVLFAIGLIGVDVQINVKNNKPEIKILRDRLGLTTSWESQTQRLWQYRLLTILVLIGYFIWTNKADLEKKARQLGTKGKPGAAANTAPGTGSGQETTT